MLARTSPPLASSGTPPSASTIGSSRRGGFTGSYSTVRRFVAEFRRERSSGAGEGFDLYQDFGHGIERNHAAIGIASGLGSGRSKKASLGSVRSKKSAMASAGTL